MVFSKRAVYLPSPENTVRTDNPECECMIKAAFLCSFLYFRSNLLYQITMRFRCRVGGFENIAFVVFQRFQPGSDVAFMLNLADNPQIRHQERTSQLSH